MEVISSGTIRVVCDVRGDDCLIYEVSVIILQAWDRLGRDGDTAIENVPYRCQIWPFYVKNDVAKNGWMVI